MVGRTLGSWATRILALQVGVSLVLVAACVRNPAGVEEGRFSADYVGHFSAVTSGEVGEVSIYTPPTHGQHSYWHVWNSQYGKTEDIHRLATQWYDQDKKRWGWHSPDSRWHYLRGHGTDPVAVEGTHLE